MQTRPSTKTRSIVREIGVSVSVHLINICSYSPVEVNPPLKTIPKRVILLLLLKRVLKSKSECKSNKTSKNQARKRQEEQFRN
jgi:hypothetical protein